MKLMTHIAGALLLGLGLAAAAAPAPSPKKFALDADVQRTMRTFDVPGVAIAIVKDGKVVAVRGFGVRRLGEAAPVDGKTVFEIASNSKGFTAAVLAMMVDEGKLGWDDPVARHLPGFRMHDAYASGAMTVRDLVSHRSGLGLGAGDLLWWPGTSFSGDEIIERLGRVKPATTFRNKYAYANLPFIVAGKLVAHKAGKSWGDVVSERILAPVGMSGSSAGASQASLDANRAAPHSKIDGKIAAVPGMAVDNAVGAVGVHSNAHDLARWMTVLLDGGVVGKDAKGEAVRLFSQARMRELWAPQMVISISEPKPGLEATRPNFLAYGLGFQVRDYKGRKLALHGGALLGYYSRVVMVPEERLGIAILTNAESGPALNALQYRILDHYLGVAPRDWIGLHAEVARQAQRKDTEKQEAAFAARVAGSVPTLPLAAYDGHYQDSWYGEVTIKAVDGKREMRFARTPILAGELEHFEGDTFIVRWKSRYLAADAYVRFTAGPDGRIASMKMAPLSMETDFSYDFDDLEFTKN